MNNSNLVRINPFGARGRLIAYSEGIKHKLPYCNDEKTISYLKEKQKEIEQLMTALNKGLIVYENQGFFAETEKLSEVLRGIQDYTVCIRKKGL